MGFANKAEFNDLQYRGLSFISKNGTIFDPKSQKDTLNLSIDNFKYTTQATFNNVIYKYNDIYFTQFDGKQIYLNNETSISEFASRLPENSPLNKISNYDGGFIYVNLENKSQILTGGGERDRKIISIGASISIPFMFEYFLSSTEKISKCLMFDLRNSLITNPLNYIIEITANYDNSLQGEIYKNE